MHIEEAILGGGCFWCVEAAFREVDGVVETLCGYANGATPDPTYEDVCSGRSGHTEVVKIAFDSDRVSYRRILELFFAIHDPTTPDRQGHDLGSQYRSLVIYLNDRQKRETIDFIEKISDRYEDRVVTAIEPLLSFYPAEEYHQNFFAKNPTHGYCRAVVAPKVKKMLRKLSETEKRDR